MVTVDNKEEEQNASTSIFINCERAFNLIKEGKLKEAEEMFPMESYLIKKYHHFDFKDLSALLAKKLTITG